MSSVIPSAKRSHLESLPMLSNGKTAIEAFSDNGVDEFNHLQVLNPANTSKTATMEAARNPKGVFRNGAGMQQAPANDRGVDRGLSRPVGLADDRVLHAVETRFVGRKCPSVDQSKWDRLGPRPRNIRAASHAGGWPRCARWDRGWDRTSGD